MFNFLYKQLLKMDNQITDKSKILTEMVNSNDTDCRYLAVSMVRNSDQFTQEHKEIIKKIPITERIRDIQDIYKELNVNEVDALIYPNPKNKKERYINACNIIPLITEVYNEGWIPNFSDSTYKYFPYFIKSKGSWVVYSNYGHADAASMGSGFYFKEEKLALDAGKKFLEIYTDYLPE